MLKAIISFFMSMIVSLLNLTPFTFKNTGTLFDSLSLVALSESSDSRLTVFDSDGYVVDDGLFSAEANNIRLALPEKYDARDDSLVTAVKNQYSTGACWAFAAISAAETSMIKKGLESANSVDYSEAHLTWFGLRTVSDTKKDPAGGDGIVSTSPYDDGGNWIRSVFALARWAGVQKDSDAPFYQFPVLMGNYDESERYTSYAHLQNSSYINSTDRASIKQAILDNGCTTLSYYSSSSFYSMSDAGYCYYQNRVTNTNHTVAVIGWDDSFSKSNFKYTPEADGAWLIKNSWGTNWGDGGYFWLSYYDTSLSYFVTFDMESADNYDNNNQYDGFGYKGWAYQDGTRTMSMANIFKTDCAQLLKAVSFHTVQTDVSYKIEIYKDIPSDGLPTDGELVASSDGFLKHRGYATVKLSEQIVLPKNTRYSAVVSITVPEGYNACIPLEFPEGFDGAHERAYYAKEGQSYLTIERSFELWEDTAASGYNNVCIKTFTDNLELKLNEYSDYTLSSQTLCGVELGTSADEIAASFKNKNVSCDGKNVFFKNEQGEIIDSAVIAYLGDVDGDDDIDEDDLSLLKLIVSGIYIPDSREFHSANLDKNRRVNADDIIILKRILYYNNKGEIV